MAGKSAPPAVLYGRIRAIYLLYPRLISETLSRKSVQPAPATWQQGELHSGLSWSHCRALMRVGRQQARDFYEIESAKCAWSVREVSRQTASLLFATQKRAKGSKR